MSGLQPISAVIDRIMANIQPVNKEPPMTFSDIDQMALRKGGWRVFPDQADKALPGGIVATVKATGDWAVVEQGETITIGSGEHAALNALDAYTAAIKLRARRVLARLA